MSLAVTPYLRIRYLCERLLIVVFLPVLLFPLLLIALLVRLDSAGSSLFWQERAGQGDRTFRVVKFRTMTPVTGGQEQLTVPDDNRITRLGRLLRPSHLDELPQLYNILRGEMSLIGPRPEPIWHVRACEERYPTYRQRRAIRPGLTGLAQVELPYVDSVEGAAEKLALDLRYIAGHSIGLDLSILLRTIAAVVTRDGGR